METAKSMSQALYKDRIAKATLTENLTELMLYFNNTKDIFKILSTQNSVLRNILTDPEIIKVPEYAKLDFVVKFEELVKKALIEYFDIDVMGNNHKLQLTQFKFYLWFIVLIVNYSTVPHGPNSKAACAKLEHELTNVASPNTRSIVMLRKFIEYHILSIAEKDNTKSFFSGLTLAPVYEVLKQLIGNYDESLLEAISRKSGQQVEQQEFFHKTALAKLQSDHQASLREADELKKKIDELTRENTRLLALESSKIAQLEHLPTATEGRNLASEKPLITPVASRHPSPSNKGLGAPSTNLIAEIIASNTTQLKTPVSSRPPSPTNKGQLVPQTNSTAIINKAAASLTMSSLKLKGWVTNKQLFVLETCYSELSLQDNKLTESELAQVQELIMKIFANAMLIRAAKDKGYPSNDVTQQTQRLVETYSHIKIVNNICSAIELKSKDDNTISNDADLSEFGRIFHNCLTEKFKIDKASPIVLLFKKTFNKKYDEIAEQLFTTVGIVKKEHTNGLHH